MKDKWRRLIVLMVASLLLGLVLSISLTEKQESENGLATYYITQGLAETGAVNAVTGIYLNYRVFDTIFEALLLAISVMAAIYLSWRKEDDE
jgi:multicomponent Na+:H+ antiporter subunit B